MKTKPLREVIAERIAEWMRVRVDLDTQVKLAARCGLGQSSVQRILHAEVNPTVESLEAIANAFNRDLADLCGRDDESNIAYDRVLYRKLPDYEKARVEGFIKHTIAQYNSGAYDPVVRVAKAEAVAAAPKPITKGSRRLNPTTKTTERR